MDNFIIEIYVMMKLIKFILMVSDIIFEFNIGTVPMREIKTEDVQAFVDYIKQQIQ